MEGRVWFFFFFWIFWFFFPLGFLKIWLLVFPLGFLEIWLLLLCFPRWFFFFVLGLAFSFPWFVLALSFPPRLFIVILILFRQRFFLRSSLRSAWFL